jgi:putative peptidoglycan lipid II flippase
VTRLSTIWGTVLTSSGRLLAGDSPLRTLIRDSLLAAGCSLVARGFGFAKEVVVAAYYGLSGALDIYLLALALIGLPANILLNAIHPPFVAALASGEAGQREAGQLLMRTTSLVMGWLALLLVLWLLLVPWLFPLLASAFSVEKQDALMSALFWLIPWYFLNAINVLAYGLLQANRRYLANGLIPVVTPIATVFVVVAIGSYPDWRALTIALAAGTALETLWLLALLYRSGILVAWPLGEISGAKRVVRNGLPLVPGMLMAALAPVLEQAIAAALGEGANAALGYGYRLPSAVTSVTATAIGITALPYFAKLLGQRRFAYCLHSLEKLSVLIVLGGFLLVTPLMLLSFDIVEVLYQRAAFDAAAAARVAPVQLAYLAQIPFVILSILAVKTLSALGRNVSASLYTTIATMLQVTVALGLGMKIGPAGIAWGAAAGSACLATMSFVAARSTLLKLAS